MQEVEDVVLNVAGVDGDMALAVPRSCRGGLVWWQLVFPRGGLVLGVPWCGTGEKPRARGLCYSASSGDARECRIPFEGVDVVPLAELGLQVETLDHTLGLDGGNALPRLPSKDAIMEPIFL
ncbi:hypothetical protein D1007_37362 [Hordeum vulgare]|nr:hypothetical protein D1007_37362 [Hordeum vulgare]